MFKHNIYGDHPEVPDGMPDFSDPHLSEFFVNPKYPPAQVAIEAIAAEVDQSEATKEHERSAFVKDQTDLCLYLFSPSIFF